MQHVTIDNEASMVTLGEQFAAEVVPHQHGVIYLQGPLGAGKTTFMRGVLRHFGHQGAVKSPTFTLVEPYAFGQATLYHFDCYRLQDPEELEMMGIRDYFHENAFCFIEWPEKAQGFIAKPDWRITFKHAGMAREVTLEQIKSE